MSKFKELLSIPGIDAEVAEKLFANGVDSIEKLANTSLEDLTAIKGVSADFSSKILEQAEATLEQRERESLSELVEDTNQLKKEVQSLVLHIQERYARKTDETKHQRVLRKEVSRTLASLERIESTLIDQLRRIGKSLARADSKISKVSNGDVEEVVTGLKKARKKIESAVD